MDKKKNPQRWKEHPHENNTRALEVWENLLLWVVNLDVYDLLVESFMEHDLAVYWSTQAGVTQPASNLQWTIMSLEWYTTCLYLYPSKLLTPILKL